MTAIDLSWATMRNIRQNLVFAFVYNRLGIPVAAGALALSSLSVVPNANRLRRFRAPVLANDVHVAVTDPVVEVGQDEEQMEEEMFDKTKKVTDPVCGMSLDPASAATHIEHVGQTYRFCSEHRADSFAVDPDRFASEGSPR